MSQQPQHTAVGEDPSGECIVCPVQVRGLAAVAANILALFDNAKVSPERLACKLPEKLEDLRGALARLQPFIDAHFRAGHEGNEPLPPGMVDALRHDEPAWWGGSPPDDAEEALDQIERMVAHLEAECCALDDFTGHPNSFAQVIYDSQEHGRCCNNSPVPLAASHTVAEHVRHALQKRLRRLALVKSARAKLSPEEARLIPPQ